MDRGSVITSCHINTHSGLLAPKGALHWIVLIDIRSERNGQGMATYYNPAMNCVESSSWAEFIASAQTPYGVFVEDVERKQEP
jgi:hypothetical protein